MPPVELAVSGPADNLQVAVGQIGKRYGIGWYIRPCKKLVIGRFFHDAMAMRDLSPHPEEVIPN